MEINRHLAERFLKNQCTADEAEYVAAQLHENPDLLNDLLPEEEWNGLKDPLSLNEAKKRDILDRIRQQLISNASTRNNFRWLSIAASLMILLSLGIYLNWPHKPVAYKSDVVYNLVKINYGKDDIPLEIEDGSFILLKAGSELHYPEHFTGKDRTFYLKGEARFKVAKDRARPFNVHAGGTVTTALGTDFTVLAHEGDAGTRIVLHEGKIVVKPEHPRRFVHANAIYLSAGEEVLVNRDTYISVRSRSKVNQVEEISPVRTAGTTEFSSTAIIFKNQSLRNIYQSLGKEFSVSIRYKEKDIADRYFTGSFKRDSLALNQILQETALLNQLHIEKRDSTYYLSQQKNNQ
ncbi:MAG: FecR family protein [Pedobacter sp.]|uniref:FecR family protein n=1 Tax=Pedobacter sp. TaxID=1411316 RepID=UPI003393611F